MIRFVVPVVPMVLATFLMVSLTQAQSSHDFANFVPDDAQVLISAHVQEIADDPGANWILDQPTMNEHLPPELGTVERLVLAGSTTAVLSLQYSALRTFDDIAHELLGEDAPKTPANTRAHRLNREFTAMIQFTAPIKDEVIIRWLSGDENTPGFAVNQRDGYSVIESQQDDVGKVVRLDDRTIAVGGRKLIDVALARNSEPSGLASHLADDIWHADLVALVDVKSVVDKWGLWLVPVESLADAEWISVAMNFDGPQLLVVEGKFPEPDVAVTALNDLSNLFKEQIEIARETVGFQRAHLSEDDLWMAEKTLDIMSTLTFDRKASTVTARVPRPDQWVKIVQQYRDRIRRIETEMQAEFDAIARELEAATDAAREAGQPLELEVRDD